jgi:hypothetical protein
VSSMRLAEPAPTAATTVTAACHRRLARAAVALTAALTQLRDVRGTFTGRFCEVIDYDRLTGCAETGPSTAFEYRTGWVVVASAFTPTASASLTLHGPGERDGYIRLEAARLDGDSLRGAVYWAMFRGRSPPTYSGTFVAGRRGALGAVAAGAPCGPTGDAPAAASRRPASIRCTDAGHAGRTSARGERSAVERHRTGVGTKPRAACEEDHPVPCAARESGRAVPGDRPPAASRPRESEHARSRGGLVRRPAVAPGAHATASATKASATKASAAKPSAAKAGTALRTTRPLPSGAPPRVPRRAGPEARPRQQHRGGGRRS